jgi:hypothetical protein
MIENVKGTGMDLVFAKLEKDLQKVINKTMMKEGLTQEEAMETETVANFKEKIDIITMLAEGVESKEEVIAKIDALFSDVEKTGIQLSTIHRSKGLEADRVFIIHRDLMPSKYAKTDWEKEQEENLRYVAITRAKQHLGYVIDFDAYKDRKDYKKRGDAKPEQVSQWVGTIGGKECLELEVISVQEMNGYNGNTQLWKMKDANGNIFTKFDVIDERFIVSEHEEVCVGCKIKTKATIKAHTEFRGVKETSIKNLAYWK